jgi:hypothetical protein
MTDQFLSKLNEWYGSYLQRYEIINETESNILLLVAARENKKLRFDIVRIFIVDDKLYISVDKSIDEVNMDSILELIQTVVRVL